MVAVGAVLMICNQLSAIRNALDVDEDCNPPSPFWTTSRTRVPERGRGDPNPP